MLSHARQGLPDEVCGLLGGVFHGEVAAVHQVAPIPNVAAGARRRFEMEGPAMVRAVFCFQRAGMEVVAVYHSHPGGTAEPSAADIAEAAWPDALYLIVGMTTKGTTDVRAWVIRAAQVGPARIVITAP
jgi:proteasome lid subunit RPN8/RPN11